MARWGHNTKKLLAHQLTLVNMNIDFIPKLVFLKKEYCTVCSPMRTGKITGKIIHLELTFN